MAEETLNWTDSDTDLGLVTRRDLADELAETVFSATVNEAAGPVASSFGYHLVLVDEVQPEVKQVLKRSETRLPAPLSLNRPLTQFMIMQTS